MTQGLGGQQAQGLRSHLQQAPAIPFDALHVARGLVDRLGREEDGEPVLGAGGQPLLLGTQYGMPDLAVGATWSVANYVFSCEDPEQNPSCECMEVSP